MDALDEARRLTAATYDERALPLTEETQWLFTRREVERAAPAVREGRTRACELYARQQAVKRVITLNLYLWNRIQAPQVLITACMYIHRFYMFESYKNWSPEVVAAASLFLAAKFEDHGRRVKDIAGYWGRIERRLPDDSHPHKFDDSNRDERDRQRRILAGEDKLNQILRMDFGTDKPLARLLRAFQVIYPDQVPGKWDTPPKDPATSEAEARRRRKHGMKPYDDDAATAARRELHDMKRPMTHGEKRWFVGEKLCMDSLYTTVSLTQPASTIAAAAFVLTCVQLGEPLPDRREPKPQARRRSGSSHWVRRKTSEMVVRMFDNDDDLEEGEVDVPKPVVPVWTDVFAVEPRAVKLALAHWQLDYQRVKDPYVQEAYDKSFSRAHALLNRWEADHVPLSTEMDGPSAIKEEQKMDLDAMS